MPQHTKTLKREFRTGLQTTAPVQGIGAGQFEDFLNGRVTDGACSRRPGIVRIAHITPSNGPYCGNFDGTDDEIGIDHDARIWALSTIPEWSLEGLCTPTSYAATRTVFARNTATANNVDVKVYFTSANGGSLICELKDDAGATTTLTITGIAAGTKVAWMVTKARSGAYTLWANSTSVSGTLGSGVLKAGTDPLGIARQNGGSRFLGAMDFVRLKHALKTDQRDGWCRLLNPWARGVAADYCIEGDAVGDVQDRSPFGMHITPVGGLAMNIASIAVNPVPVQVMQANLSADNKRILTLVAGGRQYEASIS